jgi:formylglycine-generating enzyme required for sulfatase activity
LTAITVDALNSFYSSEDGVLFNKSQTALIQYPEGKAGSYTIPNSVANIADSAFFGCTRLTGVTIPDSVTNIQGEAFFHCTGLTNVATGKGVTSIGDAAFQYCTNLTGVYFQGNVPSGSPDVFDFDNNATVYYLPGTTGWGPTFGGRPTALWNAGSGALQVSISPPGAVSAGAQWQVDGGAWQNSGTVVSNLSVGLHTVVFSTISGWITPGNQMISIMGNSTATASGAYVPAGYTFTTLAGLAGSPGSADGTGSAARFDGPAGVAVDSVGNVYVADYDNATIRKVTPGGVVTTLAGLAGSYGSADGTGSAARFDGPAGVAVDRAGNVYVADYDNATIRKVTPGGMVTTLAGLAGSYGSADGTGSAAQFGNPMGAAVDSADNVYVADMSNDTVRKVTPGGVVTTLAGLAGSWGSADGTGSAAQFKGPYGVAVDSAGNVYVADTYSSTIRKVTPGGVVTTPAGLAGSTGSADGTGSAARFNGPQGVAVDSAGNVYVADTDNNTIRKVTPGGVVTTLAGLAGSSGSTDGTGSLARFGQPFGVAVDSVGNVYVADSGNHTIRIGTPSMVVVHGPTNCVPAAPGLIGWWPGEGSAVDIVGGNNGTLQGGVAYGPGEAGQAFHFNGSDAFVSLDNGAANLPMGRSPRTVEAWVQTTMSGLGGIFSYGAGEQGEVFTLGVWGASIFVSSSMWPQYTVTANVNDGLFHHVAVVYDGANASVYMDGTLIDTRAFDIDTAAGTANIGARIHPTEFFNGAIDEVSVYASALSAAQIQAIYDAGSGGKCPPPSILTPPTTHTAEMGSVAGFWVEITNIAPAATYQWYFDGTNALDSATNSYLVLADVQPAQAGAYTVVVTNPYGSVTSDPAVLSVIPPVERRIVPALNLTADVGSLLQLDYVNGFTPGAQWLWLTNVTIESTPQLYLDLSEPLPAERFYRASQTNVPSARPMLEMSLATEIPLAGAIGSSVRVDYINQFGPTDAWVTLDTVTLTNTTQLCFDVTMFRQPTRLYRLVAGPTNTAPANMVLIPAGSFTMGNCMDPAEGKSDELPLRQVYVSAFYMDANLVSYALWQQVYQWAMNHGYSFDYPGSGKAANHPVQTIDWYDCVKWCNARSEMEGHAPAYYTDAGQKVVYRSGQIDLSNDCVNWAAGGYRLPTEAEWEKAARGGFSGHRFPWTDVDTIDWSRANYWADPAAYSYDINPTSGYNPAFDDGVMPYTSPVGYFAPNGYGLYDMAGNVWVACWDWYGSYSSGSQSDPRGASSGVWRAFRGGDWSDYNNMGAFDSRTSNRAQAWPYTANYDNGLRSVLSPGQP